LGLKRALIDGLDQSIDGAALVALIHEDLKEMGIHSMGHRLTILKSVYDEKVRQNMPVDPEHYIPICEFPPLTERDKV
jgi:hypothetical protein